jgi:hypothetical protein
MKKLIEYFKKTAYGEDTRSLTKNIREWIKDNGVKASVKRDSKGLVHLGGRVTGEYRGVINISIKCKERFDLKRFINELEECTFMCDVPGRQFPVSYIIPIHINDVTLYDFRGVLQIGTKFRERLLTEEMFWLKVLEKIDYTKSYQN